MPLLIDGHNIIGSGVLENISLQDENDEELFVSRLRVWRSNYRGKMTVIFDRGIVGGASRELSGGGVEVIFARNPQEADDWIRRRIHLRPQGLIVVTNDRALRQEAELYDIETWQADEFVRRMGSRRGRTAAAQGADSRPGSGPPSAKDQDEFLIDKGAESHVHLSDREVSEWLEKFGPSEPELKRPQRIERGPPSPSRAAFSRDQNALRKRLKGKRRKR
ncbi:MAG: NYN domain-containing protein [Caldilineaceae bacterium]|nr:NYN domain-containing protein [Caldilineaceae bacterium]MDE0631818.1 NYN domain-containing protein [Caldilineaceae bacterium]